MECVRLLCLAMKVLLLHSLLGVTCVYACNSNITEGRYTFVDKGSSSLQERSSRILEYDVRLTWRRWCHELVDWSQEPQTLVTSSLAHEYIGVPKGGSGIAVITLLKVMMVDRDPRDENLRVLHSTEKGRQRFAALLNALEYPVWFPDLYVGSRELAFGASRRLEKKAFQVFASDPKGTLNRWQKQAKTWIQNLEDFPVKYPEDRYLGGYARLYAGILRMSWDDQTEPLVERFASMERHYFDYPAIRIMAHWYRVLLAIYRDRSKSSEELNTFLQHHQKDKEWRVVEMAQQMLRSEAYTSRIIERYFSSFLRSSKPLEDQVEDMRKSLTPAGHS